jgi:hypothetical protein
MSIFKLLFNPTPNRTKRIICDCSDVDFIIVPDFLPIEVLRRKAVKYVPTQMLFDGYTLPNVMFCHDAILRYITDETIAQIERKAIRRFPLAESFYLITKPEGIDLHSFAAWVNSLK